MRRVAITGIGLLTPVGNNADSSWQSLINGKSGVGLITQFDTSAYATKIGAEVKGFDAAQWMDKREVKTMDRFLHFTIAAGKMLPHACCIPRWRSCSPCTSPDIRSPSTRTKYPS